MPTHQQILFGKARWAFSTRRVNPSQALGLDPEVAAARPGDLIFGRIVSIGQHPRIQLATGRPSTLYPGDIVILPCGARHAPDQFEGVAEIDPEECNTLADGGCLGRMLNRNARIKVPTRVQPLGRITGCGGQMLNTA